MLGLTQRCSPSRRTLVGALVIARRQHLGDLVDADALRL